MRARLERDADRLAQRALDLELDLLAVRLADVEQELLLGGEELPVEEVLELPPVRPQSSSVPAARPSSSAIDSGCTAVTRIIRVHLPESGPTFTSPVRSPRPTGKFKGGTTSLYASK